MSIEQNYLEVVEKVNVDDEPLPAAGEHLQRIGDQGSYRLGQRRSRRMIHL